MNERPTFIEVARAKPHRGSGAPARTRSHKAAILALLCARGHEGVLGSELYARPELYGRSPRNRVSELRAEGFLIEGKPHGSADWHYVLIRDNAGNEPAPRHPWANPFSERRLGEDWYTRQTGKPRPSEKPQQDSADLPLFARSRNE
jgi:hypothetical protein